MLTATIEAHAVDPNILVVKTPHEFADRMGKAEFARYDPSHRAYILHIDHLEALHKFGKRFGLYLVDQRQAPPGERKLMPECGHCGQPAKLTGQPDYCPSCGKPWQPKFIAGTETHHGTTKTCVHCDHEQPRRFKHCSRCGTPMPPDKDVPVRRIDMPRTNLDNPMSLSDSLSQTVDVLDGPTSSEWAGLAKLEIRRCKATDRQASKPTTTESETP